MKRNTTLLAIALIGIATLAVLAGGRLRSARVTMESSPIGKYAIVEPAYSQLAAAALRGDCDAAYKLGRHHVFTTSNTTEAIKWYRVAAKCPHAAAKGELLAILMHFENDGAEVDRLLTEIEAIAPKAAANDRAAVMSVRLTRTSH